MKEFQSYQAKNVIILMQHFCLQNALKLTYEHLRFQKFFRGLYPRTPASRGASSNSAGRGAYNAEGRGGEGRGGEGRGREGKGREGKGRVDPHAVSYTPPMMKSWEIAWPHALLTYIRIIVFKHSLQLTSPYQSIINSLLKRQYLCILYPAIGKLQDQFQRIDIHNSQL
jgi:hypothetical protein